jgi:hypothetical protein
MDWDKFLLKRAKEDLSMYKNYDNVIRGTKNAIIQIKEGKFNIKYQDGFTKTVFFEARERIIPYIFKQIDLSEMPDCKIPIYTYDSYDYNNNFHFCWAKPYTKPGLLFPCWSFYNWENTVKDFDKKYIPWESRYDEPYFKGSDTTARRSGVRKLFEDMYPDNVFLDDPVFSPVTDLMKYKVVFDLPGTKPWSVRTPYIDLSGSASLRVLHYYPKWGEKPWIQFYEDPKDLRGIFIEGNYDKPLKPEQINMLKDEVPSMVNTLNGKRAQNRAEKMRDRMKSLTTKHITNYISFICKYIGERQS